MPRVGAGQPPELPCKTARLPLLMSPYRPFARALPVWPKKLSGRMNTWVSFHAAIRVAPGRTATLKIAAAQAWRVWVNGELAGRGPARTAHGHARVDEWPVRADAAPTIAQSFMTG